MNPIITQHLFRVDLDSCPLEATLPRPLSHTDALADEIVLSVRRGMTPTDLSGMTVLASLTNADRQTLPLSGRIAGSSAIVPLPADCYAIPGPFRLTVQLQSGNVRHTLLHLKGELARSSSDQLISSGDLLPTLPDLLEDIADMRAATEAAQHAIAETEQAIRRTDASVSAAVDAVTNALTDVGPAIVCEASGAMVTVSDAAARPAVQVTTELPVLQSGSGDPSPGNVRPLIVRDTVRLWHGAAYDETAEAALTASLPESTYGGSLNWTTGVLMVTHISQILSGQEAWSMGSSGMVYSFDNRAVQNVRVMTDNNIPYHLCSHYKPAAYKSPADQADMTCYTLNSYQLVIKDTQAGTLDNFKAYLSAQAAAGMPVTLLWRLNPAYYTTVQLTPRQLDMLKGSNAVWSDSGDTSLVYIADTKMYIDNAIAALAAAQLNA